jgi:hypothetical protein
MGPKRAFYLDSLIFYHGISKRMVVTSNINEGEHSITCRVKFNIPAAKLDQAERRITIGGEFQKPGGFSDFRQALLELANFKQAGAQIGGCGSGIGKEARGLSKRSHGAIERIDMEQENSQIEPGFGKFGVYRDGTLIGAYCFLVIAATQALAAHEMSRGNFAVDGYNLLDKSKRFLKFSPITIEQTEAQI